MDLSITTSSKTEDNVRVLLPNGELWPDLDEKERFKHLRYDISFMSKPTISPSTEAMRALFRSEESLRYSIPDKPFFYTTYDGKKSTVAPMLKEYSNMGSMQLKSTTPPHVKILSLVRDAAARLPGGVGTRGDICTLIRDSQYIAEDVSDKTISQLVSGAVDRLHYEQDRCLQFDNDRKLWVYLHRDRGEKDFDGFRPSARKRKRGIDEQSITILNKSERVPLPDGELWPSLDESERFKDIEKRRRGFPTINPSTDAMKAYFRREELLRYSMPSSPFSYTAYDGEKSTVYPIAIRLYPKRAREHFMLKSDRPPHVTILSLVRDAAARLPGGVGTRGDVSTLIRDSQYIVEDVCDKEVNQVVSGALDRLFYEHNPCVLFNNERKLWVYRHKDKGDEDFQDWLI